MIEFNKLGSNNMIIKKIGGVRNIKYSVGENKITFKVKKDGYKSLISIQENIIKNENIEKILLSENYNFDIKSIKDIPLWIVEKELEISMVLKEKFVEEIKNCTMYKTKKSLPKIYYWKKEYNRSREITW